MTTMDLSDFGLKEDSPRIEIVNTVMNRAKEIMALQCKYESTIDKNTLSQYGNELDWIRSVLLSRLSQYEAQQNKHLIRKINNQICSMGRCVREFEDVQQDAKQILDRDLYLFDNQKQYVTYKDIYRNLRLNNIQEGIKFLKQNFAPKLQECSADGGWRISRELLMVFYRVDFEKEDFRLDFIQVFSSMKELKSFSKDEIISRNSLEERVNGDNIWKIYILPKSFNELHFKNFNDELSKAIEKHAKVFHNPSKEFNDEVKKMLVLKDI